MSSAQCSRHGPCATSCAEGVDRQVQGEVRSRLGLGARGKIRAAEGTGCRPGECEVDGALCRHPRVGHSERRPEKSLLANYGGVLRGALARRPPDGPHPRHHRSTGRTRQHARHLHPGGQRREWRRGHARAAQRDDGVQRDPRGHESGRGSHGRTRRPDHVQPLSGRLGARDGHAVPMDQADRRALRRHAQRHGYLLSRSHQRQGRSSHAVMLGHRHHAEVARSGWSPGTDEHQRCGTETDRRDEPRLHLR